MTTYARLARGHYVTDTHEVIGRTRNLFLKSGADLSRRDYDGWMIYDRTTGRMVMFTDTLATAKAWIAKVSA